MRDDERRRVEDEEPALRVTTGRTTEAPPPTVHRPPSLQHRYRRIVFFFARTIAALIWWDLIVRRMGGGALARRTALARYRHIAREFRLLAVEMGGVLIKLGQFASARVDILPEEVTDELAGLQDEVPAEDFAAIKSVIEAEFKRPLPALFVHFEPCAVAAASLGQVHRAVLPDGRRAAVKVQRPGIEELVQVDLMAVHTAIRWLKRYPPIRRRADLDALFAEFSRTLWEELDYIAEGHNAERFAENFADSPGVLVPKVYWSHTTQRVLTLEDVESIKISDHAAIQAAGIPLTAVARRVFRTYLQQVFEDGFFHADPHPGNLFVHPLGDDEERPRPFQLTFVDFGMVGRITLEMRAQLREAAIGIGTRDPHRVVQAADRLGFFLPGADLALIEQAVRKVFERYWGLSMGELRQLEMSEFREFILEFRQLLLSMPFQIPRDFIFLGRALGILSGLATSLDPDFNVFAEVQPYVQELLSEEGGPATVSGWLEQIGDIAQNLIVMPRQANQFFNRALSGDLEVRVGVGRDLGRKIDQLEAMINRLFWGVIFASLLVSGILLYVTGQTVIGAVLVAISVLIWLRALLLR